MAATPERRDAGEHFAIWRDVFENFDDDAVRLQRQRLRADQQLAGEIDVDGQVAGQAIETDLEGRVGDDPQRGAARVRHDRAKRRGRLSI